MSSKLFDYGSGHSRIFMEEGAYLPGRLTQTGWKLVTSFQQDETSPVEFGEVVKFKDNYKGKVVVPIEAGDSASDVVGVVLRTFNQIANVEYGANQQQFVYRPAKGLQVSVARKGYVSVPVQTGEPEYGAPVLIRIQEDGTNANLPIGGIEAGDAVTDFTIEVPGMVFRSGKQAPMTSTVEENVGNGTGYTATIGIDLDA